MYIDELDDEIVNECNNTYHRSVNMKHVDVKPGLHFDFNKENYIVGPQFKVGDNVRISKYKDMFARDYVPNWSEEVFVIKTVTVIKKIKNIVPRTYVIIDLNTEEVVGP